MSKTTKERQKTMTIHGRDYRFTVTPRLADAPPPCLAIMVGGMGQGKSQALLSEKSFLAGMHEDRVNAGMDALKLNCSQFIESHKAIKKDASIASEEEREAKVHELKGEYQKLIKVDQAEIVKRLMAWKLDIVCEFANENNLFDMVVGNKKSLFPTLKAMGDYGYKLRLMSVQCMDTAENIVVGTNSRRGHPGQMGLGMQKWIVTKGCLIRSAFFLDSLKCLFRRQEEEGVSLVEQAVVMTRLNWDSSKSTRTEIKSETLLASKFVKEVDRDGDIIPSADWQFANPDLEERMGPHKGNVLEKEEKQVAFTHGLKESVHSFYALDQVKRLLAKEEAAQLYIKTEHEIKSQEKCFTDVCGLCI